MFVQIEKERAFEFEENLGETGENCQISVGMEQINQEGESSEIWLS